ELLCEPARRREEHLQQACAEEDQHEIGVDPPLHLEEERQELAEAPCDDRTPEAENADEWRCREERDGALRLERLRRRLADRGGEQAPRDPRHEGRERE